MFGQRRFSSGIVRDARLCWKHKSKAKSAKAKVKAQTMALSKRDGKPQSTSSERNGSEEHGSSWIFASANEPSRSTCGMCVRLAQEGKTGRRSCASRPEQSGPVMGLQVTDLLLRSPCAFFLIELQSRKVMHVGVTRSPPEAWTARTAAGGDSLWTSPQVSHSRS